MQRALDSLAADRPVAKLAKQYGVPNRDLMSGRVLPNIDMTFPQAVLPLGGFEMISGGLFHILLIFARQNFLKCSLLEHMLDVPCLGQLKSTFWPSRDVAPNSDTSTLDHFRLVALPSALQCCQDAVNVVRVR